MDSPLRLHMWNHLQSFLFWRTVETAFADSPLRFQFWIISEHYLSSCTFVAACIESPLKDVESPLKGMESPLKDIESSLKGMESPLKDMESSLKNMESLLRQRDRVEYETFPRWGSGLQSVRKNHCLDNKFEGKSAFCDWYIACYFDHRITVRETEKQHISKFFAPESLACEWCHRRPLWQKARNPNIFVWHIPRASIRTVLWGISSFNQSLLNMYSFLRDLVQGHAESGCVRKHLYCAVRYLAFQCLLIGCLCQRDVGSTSLWCLFENNSVVLVHQRPFRVISHLTLRSSSITTPLSHFACDFWMYLSNRPSSLLPQ